MKDKLDKLQTFQWEGINRRGLRVKGELSGISQVVIQAELKRQGIEPIKIKKKPKQIVIFKQKIKSGDIVLISHHLATMISAGIPLVQALDIISKGQSKPALQSLIQTVKNDVASGKTFYDALSQHPKYFSDLFCNLIRTGELSGTLDIMLKRLAEYLEKSESIRKKIRKAMYYPITVVSISLIIAGLLLIFIVPQFERLFSSFGAKLPLFTRIVINFSKVLQHYWFMVIAAIVLGVWLFRYFLKKSKRFRYLVDKTTLRLPIFGNLIKKAIIARVTRTLATTLAAGIPMLEALTSVANVANNKVYANAIFQIREDVATGQQMHTAMSVTHVFPNMVVQMIAVGEESGAIDSMLDKIAGFYEDEVDTMVNALSTLMEPIIIIILSAIIGSFVMAMYLPIFKLGSVV